MSEDVVAALRREVALRCDREGRVEWADAAAERLLGARVGMQLRDCAPAEMTGRIDDLLDRAVAGSVDRWEACVRIDGRPVTIAFAARPHGTGVVLVGTLAPSDFAVTLQQVNDAMTELGILQRRADAQQRDLRRRNEQLERLNRELDDASQAMRALYDDVEEKAASLRRLSDIKSRVVASVNHELRTPLNAITGLAALLTSGADGPLTPDQAEQIELIRESAASLTAMVNDMLDIARMDAGRHPLRISLFTVGTLFAALRGLFRAIHPEGAVALQFDAAMNDLELETDEGKLSQILRNLVSNALKFTERGSVRVVAAPVGEDRVAFMVQDTGVGIAPEDQVHVFDEFVQVQGPLQERVRGTGLGLPLSRGLATLLGGTLTLSSEAGRGSLFTVTIPRRAVVEPPP